MSNTEIEVKYGFKQKCIYKNEPLLDMENVTQELSFVPTQQVNPNYFKINNIHQVNQLVMIDCIHKAFTAFLYIPRVKHLT